MCAFSCRNNSSLPLYELWNISLLSSVWILSVSSHHWHMMSTFSLQVHDQESVPSALIDPNSDWLVGMHKRVSCHLHCVHIQRELVKCLDGGLDDVMWPNMASAPLHLFARRAVNSLALTLNYIFMDTIANCYSTVRVGVLAKGFV